MTFSTNGRYVTVHDSFNDTYIVIDLYTREVLYSSPDANAAINFGADVNAAFNAREDFVPDPADIPDWIRGA